MGCAARVQVYLAYLRSDGEMVNPLGGIEAIYTHALSLLAALPCAHAPMYAAPENPVDLAELHPTNPGVVDPRMAAEVISNAFFQCVLKGLQRSPRIVAAPAARALPGVLNASAVSCLVIPEGVLGLPVLAALEQGIPVIAVRENRNRMRNDLATLPWAAEQYLEVENYLEAVGALAALRSGLSLASLRRPLRRVPVVICQKEKRNGRDQLSGADVVAACAGGGAAVPGSDGGAHDSAGPDRLRGEGTGSRDAAGGPGGRVGAGGRDEPQRRGAEEAGRLQQ
jgi:Protein of unknown function (DUF3326)